MMQGMNTTSATPRIIDLAEIDIFETDESILRAAEASEVITFGMYIGLCSDADLASICRFERGYRKQVAAAEQQRRATLIDAESFEVVLSTVEAVYQQAARDGKNEAAITRQIRGAICSQGWTVTEYEVELDRRAEEAYQARKECPEVAKIEALREALRFN